MNDPSPTLRRLKLTHVTGYTPSYHTMIHILRGVIPERRSAVGLLLGSVTVCR